MIIKKLDEFRKKLMTRLTKNIGKNHFPRKVEGVEKNEIKRILVCRPNQRLGNILLITPLIKELESTFPNCKIDIIVKGAVANSVLNEFMSINKIIDLPRKPFKELIKYLKIFFSVKMKKYDLVINGDKGSSSGRILTYLVNAQYKIFGFIEDELRTKYGDYEHMAKNPIYNLRHYIDKVGFKSNIGIMPNLDLKLTENERTQGRAILDRLVGDNGKKTILIFTYATGNKCHSKEWWFNFYSKLVRKFGNSFNIIEVLPLENISQIDFKATSFYSKNIREVASLIANVELFIGADSGMMHLASASGTNTIGLFSVTKEYKYQPYNNGSIAFNTTKNTTENLIDKIETLLKIK